MRVVPACAAAGVGVSTCYDQHAVDEDFRTEWDEARRIGRISRTELLEDAVYDRALNGWIEPVFHQGEKLDEGRRRYDNETAMKLLRALDPARFNLSQGDSGAAGATRQRRRFIFRKAARA